MAAAARPAVLLLLLGIASPRGTRAQTCQTCTDVRSSYMITNNLDCATWGGLWGKCSNDADWTSNLYCEYSCDVVHNFGYHVEPCCRLSPPPATPPPPLTPYHNQGYANLIFVDAANGDDNNDGSWYAPVQTLYRATNLVTDSTAVYVLDGTYYNRNYGTGAVDNAAAMNLNGFTDVLITNLPGHAPRIVFDGSGGISARNVVNFRVSGFEIDGPNQQITRWQAKQNRLLQDAKFSGRGIAVWSGSHIHIHDNVVHNCPNSGIRANEADYVTIEDNVVSNCTWWSSNAESGIVLADCAHVDTLDVVKLVIRRNTVHDNVNQIPYYNRNYDNATYMAQNQFSVVREHYGTSLQTFIIDGSGVYVTRNSASYLHGRVQLSDNVAYRNGINGLVVHKTDRAIVENNRVTNNGVVSKLAPELRQSYAGLVFNQASNVRSLSNNYVSAPFADDYAFVLDDASSFASEFVAGSNYVCVGGVSTSLSHLVAASDFCSPSPPSPPAPPPCTVRTCEGTWRRQDQLAIDVRLHGGTQHDAVCAARTCPADSGAAQASRCTLTARDRAF